jgi:outer membrane protein assembly factor BamD (BamD/ComL family)
MAQKAFDEAAFYAKVPKKPKAAILYYEQMIEEFGKSKLVPEAQKRIAEIKQLMARPLPPPPTVEKDSKNAEG